MAGITRRELLAGASGGAGRLWAGQGRKQIIVTPQTPPYPYSHQVDDIYSRPDLSKAFFDGNRQINADKAETEILMLCAPGDNFLNFDFTALRKKYPGHQFHLLIHSSLLNNGHVSVSALNEGSGSPPHSSSTRGNGRIHGIEITGRPLAEEVSAHGRPARSMAPWSSVIHSNSSDWNSSDTVSLINSQGLPLKTVAVRGRDSLEFWSALLADFTQVARRDSSSAHDGAGALSAQQIERMVTYRENAPSISNGGRTR